jgi:hypothetical protein
MASCRGIELGLVRCPSVQSTRTHATSASPQRQKLVKLLATHSHSLAFPPAHLQAAYAQFRESHSRGATIKSLKAKFHAVRDPQPRRHRCSGSVSSARCTAAMCMPPPPPFASAIHGPPFSLRPLTPGAASPAVCRTSRGRWRGRKSRRCRKRGGEPSSRRWCGREPSSWRSRYRHCTRRERVQRAAPPRRVACSPQRLTCG